MRYLLISTILVSGMQVHAQMKPPVTRNEVLSTAVVKNPQITLADLRVQKQQSLRGAAFQIESPEILFEAPTSTELRPGVLQTFQFPTAYVRSAQAQKSQIRLAEAEKKITVNRLRFEVNTTYTELQYLKEVQAAYEHQDSLLSDVVEVTDMRLQVGQISNLERLNAQSQQREVRYQLGQIRSRLRTARMQLNLLIGNPGDSVIATADAFARVETPEVLVNTGSFESHPQSVFFKEQKQLQTTQLKAQRNQWFPEFVVGYLNQGPDDTETRYRMRYGFTIPLWFWSNASKVSAAKKDVKIAEQQQVLNTYTLQGEYNQALSAFKQYAEALDYYEQTALPQAEEIARTAAESYRVGSIGYYNYLLNLQQVIKIRLGYLEALKNYNQSIFTIQYLKGEA